MSTPRVLALILIMILPLGARAAVNGLVTFAPDCEIFLSDWKLVRDRLPKIYRLENDKTPVQKVSTKMQRLLLPDKLLEELAEFRREPSTEEFVDLQDVLRAIIVVYRFNPALIDDLYRGKSLRSGSLRDPLDKIAEAIKIFQQRPSEEKFVDLKLLIDGLAIRYRLRVDQVERVRISKNSRKGGFLRAYIIPKKIEN